MQERLHWGSRKSSGELEFSRMLVVVSCNQHDPDMGDGGKEIVDFFYSPAPVAGDGTDHR